MSQDLILKYLKENKKTKFSVLSLKYLLNLRACIYPNLRRLHRNGDIILWKIMFNKQGKRLTGRNNKLVQYRSKNNKIPKGRYGYLTLMEV